MNRTTVMMLACVALVACNAEPRAPSAAEGTGAAASAAATPAAQPASPQASNAARAPAAAAKRPPLDGRSGELVNPDDSTMVLLYFDVAGMTPPVDTWVEQDGRVQYAQGPDKAAMRSSVRQELEAGAAAVQGVGRLRLSLQNAKVSRYDPAYGEFTIGAFAPSSVISYSAFRQNVELRFGNGRTAQIWRVPADEAQAISDRIGSYGNVRLDVLLEITGAQPAMSGGALVADILEFELRENRDGTTIARVQVAD